jgi:phosphopantetheinyl transferase
MRRTEARGVSVWALPLGAARHLRVADLPGADERASAGRFLRPDDSARFVAGRVLLRIAAADILGCEADAVDLARRCPVCGSDEHGRPIVAGAGGGGPRLSLTHAGEVIAVAAADGPVGIDVEPYDEHADHAAVARAMLTADELAVAAESRRAFHDLWTLKEAFLKASGLTLDDMRDVDVSAALSDPAWIAHGPSRLLCRTLALAPGHAGALASLDVPVNLRDAVAAAQPPA